MKIKSSINSNLLINRPSDILELLLLIASILGGNKQHKKSFHVIAICSHKRERDIDHNFEMTAELFTCIY